MEPLVLQTAAQLQQRLSNGEITSEALVKLFLAQIERHNVRGKGLRAVISVAPSELVISRARSLDEERKMDDIRGPLHGVPVIVKDAIVTGPELGMPTTVGSHVFLTMKALKNAAVVDKLLDAGAIILAKTNLTQFCGLFSNDTPLGWSATGGQSLSPYRRDDMKEEDQPIAAGSSSGSAMGVIAGFAPLGVGGETSGSIVFPAAVAGLYGLKMRPGSSSSDGVFRLSTAFDGIGLLARDPSDLRDLAKAVSVDESMVDRCGERRQLGIGMLPITWGVDEGTIKGRFDDPEVISKYEEIVEKLHPVGCKVVYPIEAPGADTLRSGEFGLREVAYREFPSLVKEFMQNFEAKTNVKNLQDIISFNEKHADKALPPPHTTQTELMRSLESTMTQDEVNATIPELRRLADEDGIGKVMEDHALDVVLSASMSLLMMFSACAGWPIVNVPLGNFSIQNGMPYGCFAIAKTEAVLFEFMERWHSVMEPVKRPDISTSD